jgi:hypothetical protein
MSVLGRAADNPVLRNVDRRIQKQPEYHAKRPLYELFVVGQAAQKRIWMVLDHSKPTVERYDLMYVDLNADGDLTEPTELVVGQEEGRLLIGRADDFKVFVGQQGAGPNTFWAFQEHFLPESEGVKATLIYRDAADKERQVMCLLKERC